MKAYMEENFGTSISGLYSINWDSSVALTDFVFNKGGISRYLSNK